MKQHIRYTFLLSLTIILGACSATGQKAPSKPVSSMNPPLESNALDRAMSNALAQAEEAGNTQEVLAILGQLHNRNPKDAAIASRYARALREDEQINAAIRVLQPFTGTKNPSVEALTEMSMAQLALGDFATAETFAERAVAIDEKHARAYLAMGTAQDAQNRHQEAEVSFRKGIKYWQGDASPLLNNLALNLASQGHLEESLSLIEKAQKMAPNRIELERNRRIIATLIETTNPRPPAPPVKQAAPAEKPAPVANKPQPVEKPMPAQKAATVEKQELKPKAQPQKAEATKKPSKSTENEKEVPLNQGKTSTTLKNIKLKPVE